MAIRTTPPQLCDKVGCNNKPAFSIHAEFRVHKAHPPAASTPIVFVCKDHASFWKFDDLIPEQTFKEFCNAFEAMGKMRPVKEFCNLVVQPITTGNAAVNN